MVDEIKYLCEQKQSPCLTDKPKTRNCRGLWNFFNSHCQTFVDSVRNVLCSLQSIQKVVLKYGIIFPWTDKKIIKVNLGEERKLHTTKRINLILSGYTQLIFFNANLSHLEIILSLITKDWAKFKAPGANLRLLCVFSLLYSARISPYSIIVGMTSLTHLLTRYMAMWNGIYYSCSFIENLRHC